MNRGVVNNVSVNTLPVWPLQCRTIKLQPMVLVQHHNHTAITHLPSRYKQCSGYARFEWFTNLANAHSITIPRQPTSKGKLYIVLTLNDVMNEAKPACYTDPVSCLF